MKRILLSFNAGPAPGMVVNPHNGLPHSSLFTAAAFNLFA
jgi:hypothetical protein